MTDAPMDPAELCRDLTALYRALGAAIRPDAPAADRSTAGAWVRWCDAHAHEPVYGPLASACTLGLHPSAARWVGAAVVATAPAASGRRPVPGSRPPIDMSALLAQEEIWLAAAQLAEDIRYLLGHSDRPVDGLRALAALPALVEAVPSGRWLTLGLDRLTRAWQGARWALDLDLRPKTLGPCPSPREAYTATWTADWEALAEWDDGVCREYDPAESSRATRERQRRCPAAGIVDVWRTSTLYVRDPAAAAETEEGAIRCGGCRRVWRGDAGRRELYRLLRPELREVG